MRGFLAIPLPKEVTTALLPLLDALLGCGAKATWASPDGLHFTLRFLGDITPEQAEGIASHFAAATTAIPSFTIAVQGLGAFPNTERPKVVWVGAASGLDELAALNMAAEEAALQAGLPPEPLPFHAHATLGRVRNGYRLERLPEILEAQAAFDAGAFRADRVALFESTLTPDGARYRAVAEFPLG